MKKIFAVVLSAAVVLCAAGCDRGENTVSGSVHTADVTVSDNSSVQTTDEPQSADNSSSTEFSSSVSENSSSAETSTTSSNSAASKSESSTPVVSSSSSSEPPVESSSDTVSGSQSAPESHVHQYEEQRFEPTCEESGYILYHCSCGDNYTEFYAEALGHSYTQTVIAPTCTAGGYTLYTCQRCNSQYTADEAAARGHSWGDWEISVEPTTSSEGEEISVCSECGERQRRSVPKLEGISSYVSAVVSLVNEERADAGLSPLTESGELNEYAQLRSSELVDDFAHKRPDGSSPLDHVMSMDGIHRAGENIAMGYDSPTAVMDGWMNSTGHRENILKPEFTMIGVGCYEYNGSLYWTQIFAG